MKKFTFLMFIILCSVLAYTQEIKYKYKLYPVPKVGALLYDYDREKAYIAYSNCKDSISNGIIEWDWGNINLDVNGGFPDTAKIVIPLDFPPGWTIIKPGCTPYTAITAANFQGKLYMAGLIQRCGKNRKTAMGMAVWNGTDWETPKKQPFTWEEAGIMSAKRYTIYKMDTCNNELWVWGNFDRIGGVQSKNIARFDGENWRPVTFDYEPYCKPDVQIWGKCQYYIQDMHVYRNTMYFVVSIDGTSYILYSDKGTLKVFLNGEEMAKKRGFNNFQITHMHFYKGDLYLIGSFSTRRFQHYGVLRWDGKNFDSLGITYKTYSKYGMNFTPFMQIVEHKGKLYFGTQNDTLYYRYNGERVDMLTGPLVSWDGERWCGVGLHALKSYPYTPNPISTSRGLLMFNNSFELCVITDDSNAECTPQLRTKNQEQDWESGMLLYPNPTHSEFTIEFMNVELPNFQAKVKIVNILGQEIHNQMLFEVHPFSKHRLNVGYMSAGTYFVQVSSGDKTVTKKLVVTR
jgi:hypothetical protein